MSGDLEFLERHLEGSAVRQTPSTERSEKIWAKIEGELRGGSSMANPGFAPSRYAWMVAAALLIGFVGVKYIPNLLSTTKASPTEKTYTTNPGQRAIITLADGSKVILAPATTLRSSGLLGRSVELSGEAVFDVVENSAESFSVRTGNTVTRVLGTTFGIKAYDAKIRVAVLSGKVSAGNDAILSADDMAVIDSNVTTITRDAAVGSMLAWTSGTLHFNKTPASQVLSDIGRWYGLDIKPDKQTASRVITVTFTNETQQQMLETLAGLLEVDVTRNGNMIAMKARGTKP